MIITLPSLFVVATTRVSGVHHLFVAVLIPTTPFPLSSINNKWIILPLRCFLFLNQVLYCLVSCSRIEPCLTCFISKITSYLVCSILKPSLPLSITFLNRVCLTQQLVKHKENKETELVYLSPFCFCNATLTIRF